MEEQRNVIVEYQMNLPPSKPYNPRGRVAGERYAVRDIEEAQRVHPDATIMGFEGESPLVINRVAADYLNERIERLEADASVSINKLAPDVREVLHRLDPGAPLGDGDIVIGTAEGTPVTTSLAGAVSDAVALEPTVAAAAAAAIDDQIIGRDLVEGNTVETTYNEDRTWGLVDDNGNFSWVQGNKDGGLSEEAANLIAEATGPKVAPYVGIEDVDPAITGLSFAIVDQEGNLGGIQLDVDGKLTQAALDAIGATGSGAGTLTYPIDDWAHWGDSLTAGGWPALLAVLTGNEHYNGGWGGQNTSQIAARQGGVPPLVTLADDVIPSIEAATVTAITRTPLSDPGNRLGYIAGVEGTLALSGGVHTFTRTIPGDAVDIAPKTPFIPRHGQQYRDRHVTIWCGRNGFKTEDHTKIIASIQQMIDYLTPQVCRVIVMEIPPWEGEEYGSGRQNLDAINNLLRTTFAPYWLPIATWLRTPEAEAAAGITFTTDDDTDIANGLTPRSLRADAGHLNLAGNQAIAIRVHQEAQERGWL